jgi:hypothetical protein
VDEAEHPLGEVIEKIIADSGLEDRQKAERIMELLLRENTAKELERKQAELAHKEVELVRVESQLESTRAELERSDIQLQRGREAMLEMYKLWFEAYKNQTVLDERPRGEVPEADPHPDPARVLAPGQLVEPEEDECSRPDVPELAQRNHDLRGQYRHHHKGDGGGVPQGDGPEGPQDDFPASFLQA